MPSNKAAWLKEPRAYPLVVESSEYPTPADNQILIKNRAIAFNPVDYAVQANGPDFLDWIKYPTVLASDVAGDVVEVGSAATSRFKPGDRVFGHALTFQRGPSEGASQEFVLLQTNLTSHIPASIPYEKAAVLPLAVSTAAAALFQDDYLGYQLPTTPAQKPTGHIIVIWGGSTSVGSTAIQLAVAAGLEVITTASPKNFDYVKSLGASFVFDYHSPTVVADILAALKGKTQAGAIAISSLSDSLPAIHACMEIVQKTPGKKFVACALPPPEEKPEGVDAKVLWGGSVKESHVADAIYRDFLPKALEEGIVRPFPEPKVVGSSLESVQLALDTLKKGVSATKIVVTLN